MAGSSYLGSAPGRTKSITPATNPASAVQDSGTAQRTTPYVGNAGRGAQGGPTAEQIANANNPYYNTAASPNILNQYRSVSYNFTLAGMTKSEINNPKTFDASKPTFVIASNKGKQPGAMSPNAAPRDTKPVPPTTSASSEYNTAYSSNEAVEVNVTGNAPPPNKAATEVANQAVSAEDVNNMISSFNRISPGRFDIFIDNVDIKSIFKFTSGSGTSLPTEIHFDVIEPYSINGFFEALQVAALGCGYTDYVAGNYAFIMEFWGYPDSGDTPDPVRIDEATRVFTIKIINAELDITERGTVYKVAAMSVGDVANRKSVSATTRSMKIEGSNVLSMLTDLTTQRNDQIRLADDANGLTSNYHDTYEIIFPKTDSNGNPMIDDNGKVIGGNNEIAAGTYDYINPKFKATVEKDSAYQVSNALKQPTNVDISKSGRNTVAQFEKGMSIEAIIRAVVMDSTYIGKTLRAFYNNGDPSKYIDKDGNIKYFNIITKVSDIPNSTNPNTNTPYKKYTYMVVEYPMLYTTALPGMARQIISQTMINSRARRVYNYIYTGMNVDVLDFKINFNSIFFEELPKALGASKLLTAKDQTAPVNSVNPTNKPTTPIVATQNGVGTSPRVVTADASGNAPNGSVNSTDQIVEPWQQVRKAMNSVVYGGSKSGLITGEISILGDPFFLSDHTNGNAVPVKSPKAVINHGSSQVDILINFKNPIDINGDNAGFAQFDKDQVAFSGLYQVTEVRHEFKRGSFKQTLTIVRIPGQPQNTNQMASPPNAQFGARPDPNNQGTKDTSQPSAPSTVVTSDGTTIPASQALNAYSLVPNTGAVNLGGLGGNLNPGLGIQVNLGATMNAQAAQTPNSASFLVAAQKVFSANMTVGNSIGSAAAAVSAISPSITAAVSSNNLASAVSGGVNQVQQNVQSVINGSAANNIAKQFNINPAGLTGLTGAISGALIGNLLGSGTGKKAATLLGGLAGLAASIPKNVNLQQASNQGIVLNNPTTIQDLPPLPPVLVGVTNAGFIGGNPIGPASSASAPNPYALGNSSLGSVGSALQSGRLNSANVLSNLSAGVTSSVEGLQTRISSSVGSISNPVPTSVVSQFGSSSNNATSPLVAALSNADDSVIST